MTVLLWQERQDTATKLKSHRSSDWVDRDGEKSFTQTNAMISFYSCKLLGVFEAIHTFLKQMQGNSQDCLFSQLITQNSAITVILEIPYQFCCVARGSL